MSASERQGKKLGGNKHGKVEWIVLLLLVYVLSTISTSTQLTC